MGRFVNRGSKQERSLDYWGLSPGAMVGRATANRANAKPVNTPQDAMGISAVWAAVRLRSDLISTFPIETYRTIDNMRVDVGATPFINSPGFMEFLASSQRELDTTGNSIGTINSFYVNNVPADITLYPSAACQVLIRDNKLYKYRIGGTEYWPDVVWHEKQFTVSGLHVGLSPIEAAAFTLGQFASVQEFASQWFMSGNGPRVSLKNTEKKIDNKAATIAKESWKATQAMGEPFVHGSDWEYSFIQAQSASNDWLEAQRFGLTEAARYFGVPADLLDAAMSGDHVTYANVVQRNLQFLIMNLGPAIRRRENALSMLLPRPRSIRFDENALLRMDPVTVAQVIETKIKSKVLAPSEARALENKPPFTLEQMAEFNALGLNARGTTPQTSSAPIDPVTSPLYSGQVNPTGIDGQPHVTPALPDPIGIQPGNGPVKPGDTPAEPPAAPMKSDPMK
jgi:HK97 family phage portal protein